ncbi:hypothetical protein KOW79_021043 [Hemibagrus wyckioides]|uniref:B30.2/SPRY domain-containing protein n=1 Tax=Hemibagrus wyckioides TaxID=337641 RepID=A0A9D3S9Y0_9TELE|nr:hypothetical protein KOW79_021043 [Hemibagrus wyckioides]
MVWIQLLLFSHLLSFTPLTTLSRSELEDQLKKKKKNISDLEKDNKEIEDQLKQKEKELSDLREKNADVMSENERLRGDVKKLNNRVKALEKSEDQLRQTEKEISELKRKNNKLLDEKENLQDVTKLKKQLKDLEKAVTTSFPVTINSLRFDPNTAHSRLQISDDWQSASVFETGFTSGRPYWEVSAPRKGEIDFRPSNRYWVIQKRNRQLYMLTEQDFLRQLPNQLNIIGVLIDFSLGEVTFYNSETRTFLCVFRGNRFTEKLYRFVATCGQEGPEDWPIELLDTGIPNCTIQLFSSWMLVEQ